MIRIGFVGAGKIVRDQHLAALERVGGYEVVGTVNRRTAPEGMRRFDSLEAMLCEGVDAVSIATPPQIRTTVALEVIGAGRHVFLEKPPAATVTEVAVMEERARDRGVTLFTSWHSRASPAVVPAREWLASRKVTCVEVEWCEDVRRWHPGQQWIWEAGGLGVFDPGINALSILTRILPEPIALQSAELEFPENRAAPIAARLEGALLGGAPVTARFDWRQEGPQTWDIRIDTADGRLEIALGGARLSIAGEPVDVGEEREYANLYARFAELVAAGQSEVDARPLQLVADAFLVGQHRRAEAFED
jgi:predicted dehydrogenase